jgi:hypothetical protein
MREKEKSSSIQLPRFYAIQELDIQDKQHFKGFTKKGDPHAVKV